VLSSIQLVHQRASGDFASPWSPADHNNAYESETNYNEQHYKLFYHNTNKLLNLHLINRAVEANFHFALPHSNLSNSPGSHVFAPAPTLPFAVIWGDCNLPAHMKVMAPAAACTSFRYRFLRWPCSVHLPYRLSGYTS
jgi:hypothetical protein